MRKESEMKQAQKDITESLEELLTWMKNAREKYEAANLTTTPALVMLLRSWIEILEPCVDALPEVIGENKHLVGCAEVVLRMGKLDLTDPMQLILVNVNLGTASALAKIGLGEK